MIASAHYEWAGKNMSMSISGSGGMRMPQMDPQEMKAKMQEKLSKLKESNPELADKMEKIGSRMESLRESGADAATAMKTIESEFGKPTEAEMKSMKEAFGTPAGPGGKRFEVGNKGMQSMMSGGMRVNFKQESESEEESSTQALLKAMSQAASKYQTGSSSSSLLQEVFA